MSKQPKWTVTRQCQWPDGGNIVEVSSGGLDYTNPDALAKKYVGEFQEFTDPRDAAETAIAICKAWRKDGTKNAKVGHGATGGGTFPFDGCTFNELLSWAKETHEKLEKCAQCGDILVEKWGPFCGEEDCCSQYCAEKHYAPIEEKVA